MLFNLIFLVGLDQHVFLEFYYKTIILSKIAKFQVRSNELEKDGKLPFLDVG